MQKRLAVLIPYFSYGKSAFRDMLLRRLLAQLDHPRIDVFVSAVDVDLRRKMQALGPANRWEHVNILPTKGGDVMWQKAFALNYGKRVLADRRKDYSGLCLLDADADLGELVDELVVRAEHLLRKEGDEEIIASPFPIVRHNGIEVETAWSRLSRTAMTFDNCPRYSSQQFRQNPPGGCLLLSWGAAARYNFCEWLPVGGDDSVFFSQILGDLQAKSVVDDEHVAPKLRPAPDIHDDGMIINLLYNGGPELQLLIKAYRDTKAVLPFGNHGNLKAATYVSRHSITQGHNLLHCVSQARQFQQPVYWDKSAPEELRNEVAEYMRSI